MGALKAALTAIFNANNYTSSTSGIGSKKIPVNESNGLPSGQISMADLASVLLSPNNNEFNNLGKDIDATDIPFGFYQLQSYETENPSKLPYTPSTVNRGILLNFDSFSGGKRGQVIFNLGEGRIYARYYRSASNPWTAWKSITFTT